MSNKYPPEGHPISEEKAKELLSGDLARVLRDILKNCCVPIYWVKEGVNPEVLHNGTLTLVRTPSKIIGITAEHVIREYYKDSKSNKVTLYFENVVIDDLNSLLIDSNEKYDLATFEISEEILNSFDKEISPLANWPPKPPQEGRGIMIAGYPGIERLENKFSVISFGLFTALVIARSVTETQITWLMEREYQMENTELKAPPEKYNLGGVSGGPLISLFESENYVAHFCISGIVTEHPDYEENEFVIERLVAVRADIIGENGKIFY